MRKMTLCRDLKLMEFMEHQLLESSSIYHICPHLPGPQLSHVTACNQHKKNTPAIQLRPAAAQSTTHPVKMSTKLRKIETAFLATTNWNIQDMESGIRQHLQAAKIYVSTSRNSCRRSIQRQNTMKTETQKTNRLHLDQNCY